MKARGPDSPPDGPEMTVIRCDDCGLAFTNPRPGPAIIGRYYPTDYQPHQPPAPPKSRRWRPRWWRRWQGRLGRFRPHRLELPVFGQGRLLDFGCGSGAFLRHMADQGWTATGLDLSSDTIERVHAELGLRVLQGTLPHPAFEAASLEVVTMWESLEHVHEPLAVLGEAHRLLVPGGRLMVSAPNIGSLPARWFGPAWYGLDLPRHLVHFSPVTLRAMVERAGFEVVSVGMGWDSGWTQQSAHLHRRLGRSPRWLGWCRRRLLASLLGRWCLLTGQSDSLILTARRP